jgi:hypothetical protein
LLSADQTYHITDISKGAMTVGKADVDRRARYGRWAALLDDEIRLVAKPDAWIIAVGGQVCRLLKRRWSDCQVACIMHYAAWAKARDAGVKGREAEFRAFADAVSMQDIVDVASDIMREKSIPADLSVATLNRLRKAKLSESRKKLAFVYATCFARLHDGEAPCDACRRGRIGEPA